MTTTPTITNTLSNKKTHKNSNNAPNPNYKSTISKECFSPIKTETITITFNKMIDIKAL